MNKKANITPPVTFPKGSVSVPKPPMPHSIPPKAEPQSQVPPTSKLPPPQPKK